MLPVDCTPLLGEAFVIPKGAPIYSVKTGEWTPATRKQTVYPYFVDTYRWLGTVVGWAGAGGYWRRVHLNEVGEFIEDFPEVTH